MTREDVLKAIRPLRLIFWGGLICVFDITVSSTVNGEGFKFDFINDFVGMILITVGVFKLGGITVHERYRSAMIFVKIIAVIETFNAFLGHFVFDMHPGLSVVFSILTLLVLAAVVVFCIAMRWLCQKARLERSAGSWRTTMILHIVILVIPVGLFYLAAIIAILTGESFFIDLGPAGLLLLFAFAIPVIHLFISTSRMAGEAAHMPPADYETPPGK